ncbi:MAG: hypothetical protein Q9181_001754 [Wetmoreana brouardii]
MTDAQIKQCTTKIKAMADVRKLAIEDTDVIINQFYHNLSAEQEQPLLADLTLEEKKAFAKKEMELNGEPEMQKLDDLADAHTNGNVDERSPAQRMICIFTVYQKSVHSTFVGHERVRDL